MSRSMKKRFTLLFLIFAVVIASCTAVLVNISEYNEHLDEVREQAFDDLERYDGRYDTQSIVLKKTNSVSAEKLAKKNRRKTAYFFKW